VAAKKLTRLYRRAQVLRAPTTIFIIPALLANMERIILANLGSTGRCADRQIALGRFDDDHRTN
jgi:hypothetical protein